MKHTLFGICALALATATTPSFAQLYTLTFSDPVDQTCQWTVDKTVTPTGATRFEGDSQQVQWNVNVTFDGLEFSLEGTLTVNSGGTNRNNKNLYLCVTKNGTDQGACLNPSWTNLGSSNGYTHVYPYSFAGPYTKGGDTWAVRAEIRASNNTTVEQNTSHALASYFEACSSSVEDDSGTLGTATEAGPNSWQYTESFSCDGDEGENTNTATVDEDEDSATFTLTCLELGVEKTADASLTRTWTWSIDKEGDQTEVLLNTDTQTLGVNYDVEVDANSLDSDWSVSGDIDVTNPASYAVTLTDVTDMLDMHGAVSVDCDDGAPVVFPYSLGAGATLGCTYSESPSDGTDTENIAFASLRNYSYTYLGVPSAGGTTDFSDTTDVSYTINHVDDCIDVDDTLWDGNESPLVTDMTICATGDPPDTLPYTFEYEYTIGPYTDFCDGATFSNTASFLTDDQGLTGSKDWDIDVTAECETDCVLGFGYWKNHAEEGHAPVRDPNWDAVGGEDTPFFLSGQTYYEVLWTNPKGGNAYYILAHHYIPAELNFATGASVPTAVQDAFDAATALFESYTPDFVAGLKGKNGKVLRQQFIDAKDVLEQYNTGYCVDNPGADGCPVDVSDYPPYCTQEPEDDDLSKAVPGTDSMSIPESDVADVDIVPTEFSLSANYPNPFNPSTTISFQLPESSPVRLSVFDIQGREVARLVDGSMPAGTHNVQFSAGSLPSGIYVYTLSAGGNEFRRTMLLLK